MSTAPVTIRFTGVDTTKVVDRLEALLARWREDDIDTCLQQLSSALEELERLAGVAHRNEDDRVYDVQQGEQLLADGMAAVETLRNLLGVSA